MKYVRLEVHPRPGHEEVFKVSRPVEATRIKVPFYLAESGAPDEVFCDPVIQGVYRGEGEPYWTGYSARWVVEVSFRPGVTDNPGLAAEQALALFGVSGRVASGELHFVAGDVSRGEAESLAGDLANALTRNVSVFSVAEWERRDRFTNPRPPDPALARGDELETVPLDGTDEELLRVSGQRLLALDLGEMRTIRGHYEREGVRENRLKRGLPGWPTDVEMEVLAQPWSEHCKHKIFQARVDYRESADAPAALGDRTIESLFRTCLRDPTMAIIERRGIDWVISLFHDNAGIVRFDPELDLCIKVETHNSPSALDPYGGALTGILGVNRDILGCGLGAKCVANMDVFCLAPPEIPDTFPPGLKHPRSILDGVHKGVEDGGNKSGIPTINGAFYFHRSYLAKPLVYAGTIGVLPPKLPDGRDSSKKRPHAGDLVYMVGGAVGADGIHGATFSSLELKDEQPAGVVQIGDPLMQKRVTDFLLEARDLGLYTCITDNGAGGLSSSVGEMAELVGGARVDLSRVPLKYPGLRPFEIMVSESQERMTLAVGPEHAERFEEVAAKHGVWAGSIGEFNESGFLEILHEGRLVGLLDLEFLHEGTPVMALEAFWDGPREYPEFPFLPAPARARPLSMEEALPALLSGLNVCSKEGRVRRYDHEVQASTVLRPLDAGDAGGIWLRPHGGGPDTVAIVGCGLAPHFSPYDPYAMAQAAVDEALRNVVASGGDPDMCCLLDNFCWPDPVASDKNPDGGYKLGQLVRACVGLKDAIEAFGTPLVSGKDSMKNDYRGLDRDGRPVSLSVLPTLLVTALARGDVRSLVGSAFRRAGDRVYLCGPAPRSLVASEYSRLTGVSVGALRPPDLSLHLQVYRTLHRFIRKGRVRACHDVSDGGLIVALAEMALAGGLGADVEMPAEDVFCFSEDAGRLIAAVPPEFVSEFEEGFAGLPLLVLGTVTDGDLRLVGGCSWSLDRLKAAFSREV